jgi:hypothetical protein
MFGALGGWSGLQVLVEERKRSGNIKTICQELPGPGRTDRRKERKEP